MRVAEEFTPVAVPGLGTRHPGRSRFGSRLALTLRALAAGMRASKDYRLLNGMSDGQLGRLGLSREDIPRELHRRHFAGLGGAPAGSD